MIHSSGSRSVVSSFSHYNLAKSLRCGKTITTPAARIYRFSGIYQDLRANDRLLEHLCCISKNRFSTDKFSTGALSTISNVQQVTLANCAPDTEDEKIKLSSGPQREAKKKEPEEKQSKKNQLKKIFKEYGAVGVSFHIGISLISLGVFYVALSSGINMSTVLCKLGFSESVVQSKMATGTSTFVLAYTVHKFFAPVRISVTIVSVPLIVRFLRKIGLFKPT